MMAQVVVGIGSSHTPQLSSGVDMWEDHAERDRSNPELLGTDGEFHSYGELLAAADPRISEELAPEVWERKYRRGQEAVAELTRTLAAARADVAVVIVGTPRCAGGGRPSHGCAARARDAA